MTFCVKTEIPELFSFLKTGFVSFSINGALAHVQVTHAMCTNAASKPSC